MVNIEVIDTGSPKAGPYSLGIKTGNLIFISGQVPDPEKKGIREQTLSVLEKIKSILGASGANVSNIVKTSVFLKNMDDFRDMNQAYKDFFEKNGVNEKYPARSTVEATCPMPSALVEIDAIAAI
ncbi:MAG: RidA family protein [Candidatus Lokiarchaeota archaeon]|nr:RidA family protein [Candidatus Lokiarchaeota archaeon]